MATKSQPHSSARLVTRAGLAEVFGASLPTVDTWRRAGCPVVKKGGKGIEWQFDTADVIEWLRERAVADATGSSKVDETELRRRRLDADTQLAELALVTARGLVAPLDQVERMTARAFAEVRAGMRNIPGRVVSLLIGETDERKFKRVLLGEIDQALEALANADLAGSDDDAENAEDDLDA